MNGSTMLGLDPGQLRGLAARLDGGARQLRSAHAGVAGLLRGTDWRGHRADAFRRRWSGEGGGGNTLLAAACRLEDMAGEARRQAAQQVLVSTAAASAVAGLLGRITRGLGDRPTFDERIDANRERVKSRISDLEVEIAALERRRPDGGPEEFAKDLIWGIDSESEKLAAEIALKKQELARLEGLHADRRSFLLVDSTPGDNRVVEVYGDLDAADRVIIHVPGMSTDLDEYGGRGNAAALNLSRTAAEVSSGTGEKVAVVSFMDYNVPDDVGEAASGRGADSGVAPLRSLVADLHDQGFDTEDISVVAHSYGSVVTGHAMQEGLDVGRVIAVGSPGMAGGSDERSDLGSPHVELWAGTAPADVRLGTPLEWVDPVSDLPGHGEDPTSSGFGANQLPVPDARGHSRYFTPRSDSLENIVRVAVGQTPRRS